MRLAAILALVFALLALGGCGSAPEASDERRASSPGLKGPPAPPDDPAPSVGFGLGPDGAPPPAWIATAAGSDWLEYATFCWKGGCADAGSPRCGDPRLPHVPVTSGERVSFHLGFQPWSAELHVYSDDDPAAFLDALRLEPARVISWTADREGPIWLSTWAVGLGRDAAYAACLRFEPEPLTVEEALARGSGDVAVRGTLYVDGDETRLCGALAESYPPRCPQESLVVVGADVPAASLRREGGVAWSAEPVTLVGTLDAATLVVSG